MILWIYNGFMARIEEEPVPTVRVSSYGKESFVIARKVFIDFSICSEWRRTLGLDSSDEEHLLKIDLSPGVGRGTKIEFWRPGDYIQVRPHALDPAGFKFCWGCPQPALTTHLIENDLIGAEATSDHPAVWTWRQVGRWRFEAVD